MFRTLPLLLAVACGPAPTQAPAEPAAPTAAADPLPSWNDGATKQALLTFVEQVADEDSRSYLPPMERIAVFDNDGTLWPEEPFPFQAGFVFERVRALASANPHWAETQPYKAVIEDDQATMAAFDVNDLYELTVATGSDQTEHNYYVLAKEYLKTAKHPRFERPVVELTYQPMLELVQLLQANDFQVWIVTGGGASFVRSYATQVYDIPPSQVIGSAPVTFFRMDADGPKLIRTEEVETFNDAESKPSNIWSHIGQSPVLAVGNSDTDTQMLQFADDGDGPGMSIVIRHDDAEREWDYTTGAEGLQAAAQSQGWTVVSIKNDWSKVFSE